jgi:hypothetical protein
LGRVMFFLLRMAFWLGVVCVLVPSSNAGNTDAKIDPGQALTVATAAMSDARGFCERQPQACEAGGQVATALGHKAEAGARTLYQFISAKLTEKPEEKAAEKTPSLPAQGTLTADDLQPAYREPVPLPPKREKLRPAV